MNTRDQLADAARLCGFTIGLAEAMKTVRALAEDGDLHTRLAASAINERLMKTMMQTTGVTTTGELTIADRGEDFPIYAVREAAE